MWERQLLHAELPMWKVRNTKGSRVKRGRHILTHNAKYIYKPWNIGKILSLNPCCEKTFRVATWEKKKTKRLIAIIVSDDKQFKLLVCLRTWRKSLCYTSSLNISSIRSNAVHSCRSYFCQNYLLLISIHLFLFVFFIIVYYLSLIKLHCICKYYWKLFNLHLPQP